MSKGRFISRKKLFARPEKAFPQISPDGKYIVYIAYQGDNTEIRLIMPDTDNPDITVHVFQSPAISLHWTYLPGKLLVLEHSAGEAITRLQLVDVQDKTVVQLAETLSCRLHLLQLSSLSPGHVLLGANNRNQQWFDVYRIDLETGGLELIYENDRFSGFLASGPELRLAVVDRPDGSNAYYLFAKDQEWRPLFEVSAGDAQSTIPVCISSDNRYLYLKDSRQHDTVCLSRMRLDTTEIEVLAKNDHVDIEDTLEHPVTQEIDAVSFNHLRKQWQTVDTDIINDIEFLRSAVNGDLAIVNRDQSLSRWIVGYVHDDKPNEYHLYQRETRELTPLFSNIADVASLPLMPMHSMETTSRHDNLPLTAYYTLPVNIDSQQSGLPVVVLIHGGPWTRDKWGYNPWHQWLANRGYIVLSVNFRGSTGFGKAFMNAGNREWGGKMLDDIDDAIQVLSEAVAVDKSRIALMGTSYGGYAALMLAARYPSRYCCAIDIFGPTDLVKMIESIPPQWQSQRDMLKQRVGDPDTDEGRAQLCQHSPIQHVKQINTPLMIVEGFYDPRVDRNAIRDFVQAIEEAKPSLPVIHLSFPDEGHNLAREKNRMTLCALAERFLARFAGGDVEPTDTDIDNDACVLSGREILDD